jgi:hypothetical protein
MRMFEELCGFEAMSNVVVVTNMWGNLKDPGVGEKREEELRTHDDFLGQALSRGARMMRHDNTSESAEDIVSSLLGKESVPLQIQLEMIDEGKALTECAAGAKLNSELMELMEKSQKELSEVQAELEGMSFWLSLLHVFNGGLIYYDQQR